MPGPRKSRPAVDLARREELAVEELRRAVDGVAEVRGADHPPHPALNGELVTRAAAEDQERRTGRAHTGIVEALEERRLRSAQVVEVHVVDDVRERAKDAEGARRLPGRAVVDVASLAAVVPVDRRHAVRSTRHARRDRRGGGRRDGREHADALREIGAAPEDLGEHRCLALLDRALEHRRLESVDDYEDELRHT